MSFDSLELLGVWLQLEGEAICETAIDFYSTKPSQG
jgi:hypothetical protein